jgi:tetratricopeptide (TPR) repeat protein
MRSPSPRVVISVVAAFTLFAGSSWWILRPRPTLDGAAERIASGRFKAAEGQLREYLAAYPNDELARLLLARVLVDRPEPEPETALGLIDGLQPADPHRAALVRAIEGDAQFWSGRYDRAEPAWLEALRLEPTLPEVGWKLLNIYALQGRDEDSRRLALRLFATEPDERDRVQLLLQLIRLDAHPIEAGSIVHALEPIAKANPVDLRSSTALGLALIGSGRPSDGLDLLRRSIRSHVDDESVRLAYLDGLVATGGLDELAQALGEMPRPMADSPKFDAARGWLASQSRELDEAARFYRRALDVRPTPPALVYTAMAHRFKGVLRQANRAADLAELEPRLETIVRFPVVVRDFFDRINEMPDLGIQSHPEDFERLASVLRQVGRVEEAEAWTLLARHPRQGSP